MTDELSQLLAVLCPLLSWIMSDGSDNGIPWATKLMFEKNENAEQMTNVGESLQLSSPLLSDCVNRQKLQWQRKLEIIYFYKYFFYCRLFVFWEVYKKCTKNTGKVFLTLSLNDWKYLQWILKKKNRNVLNYNCFFF